MYSLEINKKWPEAYFQLFLSGFFHSFSLVWCVKNGQGKTLGLMIFELKFFHILRHKLPAILQIPTVAKFWLAPGPLHQIAVAIKPTALIHSLFFCIFICLFFSFFFCFLRIYSILFFSSLSCNHCSKQRGQHPFLIVDQPRSITSGAFNSLKFGQPSC